MIRKTNFSSKNCLRCGQEFSPVQWNQLYCGSKSKKVGCSWERQRELKKERSQTSEYKEYQKEYGKIWKKEQRRTSSDYAKRQRASKRKYGRSKGGKAVAKRWRQNNKEIIRSANRRRKLRKMNVFGSHTQEEWEHLKSKFDYKCVECGVFEEELGVIYPNTQFMQLTRDHVIPISKGGTDFISNIQPLCISCNTKKRDALSLSRKPTSLAPIIQLSEFEYIRGKLGKIVCTSLPADPIHPGHLSCLRESTMYGDSLVVIVNGDWFLSHKKGSPFMPLEMRTQIVSGFRGVDIVVPFEVEDDITVCEALRIIRPHVFTKGGDRFDSKSIPEWSVCEEYGIEIVTGVGDSKVHSSSNILEDWYNRRLRIFFGA